MSRFQDYHLKEYINNAIKDLHFDVCTEVQKAVLPRAIKGENLMVQSATGSGKTHSFMIPVFQNLVEKDKTTQAVIIAPTRELCEQLFEVASQIASFSNDNISIVKAVGGMDRTTEISKYETMQPQIVIGTIGRIKDLVLTSNVLKIHNAKMVIIDEADMIFDQEELIEVDQIMGKFISEPSFMVFSATISVPLRQFLNKYLNNVQNILLEEKNLTPKNITHWMLQCKAKQKEEVLLDLLKIINPYLCIIFVNTKENADKLSLVLAQNNIKVAKLHGAMEDRDRKQMLRRIKDLEFKYIVASDIAARGIDIEGVSHVINFDLPKDLEFYIHRCGRTARAAGYQGIAISLYAYEDDAYVNDLRNRGLIIKFMKIKDNELIETKLEKKKSHSFVRDIETRIHQEVKMPKKVKPGYKKKRMEEIEKKIKLEKRAHIKEIYKKRAQRESGRR